MCAVAVLVVVALTASFVSAEDKDKVSVTVTSVVLSKYIGSAGSLAYDKPVWQTDIFISLPKGFYIDLWHSGDLRHGLGSQNYGNEIDWTFGWSPTFKWAQVDVGATYIDEPSLFGKWREDYVVPYLEVRRGIDAGKGHTLIPYLRAELILPVKMDWEGRDDRYFLGTRHQWKVAPWLTLNSNLAVVHGRANEGIIGKYDLFAFWPVSKKVSLIVPAIKTALPISGVAEGHHSEIAVGAGISFNF